MANSNSKTVMVVGVRKLGREIARHFGSKGWRVVCAARTAADVEEVARDVKAAGGEGIAFVCDLKDRASLEKLDAKIDLVIASQSPGGRFGSKPLLEIDDGELSQGFSISVQGTWNLMKAIGGRLVAQNSGAFLQIGTSSGMRTKEGFAALGANQYALRALVQVAAKEWRAHGVHVAYVPIDGPIESEASLAFTKGDTSRLISPNEIARACEYLYGQAPTSWTHELVLRPTSGDWSSPT
jgi:NAD(P)-dependent dehydrogenase (short-subunit alcohol dehydrogenase family)